MVAKHLEIKASGWKSWKGQGQTLVVFAFQDTAPSLLGLSKESKVLAGLAQSDGFKGKERESFIARPTDNKPAERVIMVGLGKKSEFNLEVLRRAASRVVKAGES